ncbi:phage portal protein [Nocardioides sp. Leaf307]|uniref:phage portal protein n=1 Tax=Nocardioides sp. Leaf307 TaxID=1736331 RepID=UPI000AD02985|nr:phage portal protein [Nocardioides sp. Leaf307]
MPLNPVNLTGFNDTAVSTDRALGLAGVFRAVSILGTSVSQLEIGAWRKGQEVPTKSTDLVVRPDGDTSRAAFLEKTTVSLATDGNAFWFLRGKTSPDGKPRGLEVLDPQHVILERNQNGKLVYRYHNRVLQEWQVKHLWLMRLPGYDRGVGPIQVAQNELRGALDLRNYSDNWFRTGGVPSGVLSTDNVLTAEQAEQYRDEWDRRQYNRGTAVLGKGLSYQPVYLAPKDAMFIESMQFSVTQIARMFGIPATYLMTGVEGNSMTYTNTEQVDTVYVKYTLMKYLTEIESALTDLLPEGQTARFKVEMLLRADTKTRYDAYKVALESQWLTPNEVRAKEGYLPIEGGDTVVTAPVGNKNESSDSNAEPRN